MLMSSTKKNTFKILYFLFGFLFVSAIFIFIILFNNVDSLLYDPFISPEMWCEGEPCNPVTLFGWSFTFIQPLSSFIVYLLGVITIGIGIYLLVKRESQKTRTWWGIALILWGIGTLLAGTSYQAFGYELKCEGNPLCLWTSLFEIFYLLLTVYSVNAMMMSQVYSSSVGKWRKFQLWFAPINSIVYSTILLIGTILPLRFLISFELMVLFVIPSMLMFFINNILRYVKTKSRMELLLMFAWMGMALVMVAYYVAAIFGLTEIMWEQGIWFSDNDVLHIGLIAWMFYVGISVRKYVIDIEDK